MHIARREFHAALVYNTGHKISTPAPAETFDQEEDVSADTANQADDVSAETSEA
jgi:hypothetical protein